MKKELESTPTTPSGAYLTLEQAAYVLMKKPSTLLKLIKKGELLSKGVGDDIRINQTEIDRIKNPWKHVLRLDARISSQQALVETLKEKINSGKDVESVIRDLRSQIWSHDSEIDAILEALNKTQRDIVCLFGKLDEKPKGFFGRWFYRRKK